MARIEYMAHRLRNWAYYKASESSGGFGHSPVSAMMSERVDESRNTNIIGSVEAGDALTVDAAVEAMKAPLPTLYKTVHVYYLEGSGDANRAAACGCSVSTMHARLGQADRWLLDWLDARRKPAAPAPPSIVQAALLGRSKIIITP